MNTEQDRVNVGLWELQPSRFQPRDEKFDAATLFELAQSIHDNGLINAVLVFNYDDADGYVVWELIAGERRTRACVALALAGLFAAHSLEDWCARLAAVGLAGMGDEERQALRVAKATIPAVVHAGSDMQAIHLLAVKENLDRENLSILEEARAYAGLQKDYRWSQRELAGHVGRSQGYVAQRLSMLDLPEVALDAMNTRVIGFAHARAIAAVPKVAQRAATAWTISAAGKDAEKPATTRDVEDRLQQLATFLDPERWQPNGVKVYQPEARNRLRAIRSRVTQIGPDDVRQVLELAEVMVYGANVNLLKKSPIAIIQNSEYFSIMMNALGMHTPSKNIMPQYTAGLGLTCEHCIFDGTSVPLKTDEYMLNYLTHCPRWYNGAVRTCEHCITADDPVVIPVNNVYVKTQLGEQLLHADPNLAYTDNRDVYIHAVAETVRSQSENIIQERSAAKSQHLDRMRAWYDWQKAISPAILRHPQAHTCEKCAHYEPRFAGQSLPPCQFALNTLTGYGGAPRAPEFVVWIGEHNETLPRCEQFAYRELPTFGPYSDHYQFPNRPLMSQWIAKLFQRGFDNTWVWKDAALWGPLHWLYTTERSYAGLWSWIARNWDTLGDDTVIHLVQIGISETNVITKGVHGSNGGEFTVLHPVTALPEKWTARKFTTDGGDER